MNIQIFPLVGGNTSSTRPAYKREEIFVYSLVKLYNKANIYDEVTEDIFDMSKVRFFKEIEKKKRGMFILCYVFGQLFSVKGLV